MSAHRTRSSHKTPQTNIWKFLKVREVKTCFILGISMLCTSFRTRIMHKNFSTGATHRETWAEKFAAPRKNPQNHPNRHPPDSKLDTVVRIIWENYFVPGEVSKVSEIQCSGVHQASEKNPYIGLNLYCRKWMLWNIPINILLC